jgi:hypothetical protein
MERFFKHIPATIIICLLTLFTTELQADGIEITISKGRGTTYSLLNRITEQTGLFLIYDSRLIENDKRVRVESGSYTLEEFVRTITGNNRLNIKIEGNHLLIYIPADAEDTITLPSRDKAPPSLDSQNEVTFFSLSGRLKDRITGEPIVYGTVSVDNYPLGTVTNNNGDFKLTLPDSLLGTYIKFSHLGYLTRTIEESLLSGQELTFWMDQRIIPLQEIVVRAIDPHKTLREMLSARSANYSKEPVYLTTFYREGVEYKENITLSEAVLKIYKTGINYSTSSEQVKVLKMRRLSNPDQKDTLVTKIKSSINSSLLLDLVKNPPDFLIHTGNQPIYDYSHTDITVIDDRRVYVISFKQKEHITAPLYRGKLYIDALNFALVEARFEVNPEYVKLTKDDIIIKSSRSIEIIPESISYIVSYKPYDGVYYLNHVRGDLKFKVRRKRRVFGSSLHAWFDMVNCNTEISDVSPFARNERISTRDIFSEMTYSYDKDFWGNFNVIIPEDNLKEFIRKYNFK